MVKIRHEFSDKGERQLRAFGAFIERLANNMGRLALAVEKQTEQMEKCRKDKEKKPEEIRA